MSSGLYVPARDKPRHTPGVGLNADRRLCADCSEFRANRGGGFINGGWRCATCKPVKEVPAMSLSKWMKTVHEHCLRTGVGITPSQAIQAFGPPPTSATAGAIFNSALRDGWFRREEWQEQGVTALVWRSLYYAVDKEANPPRRVDTRTRWFQGLQRVRSVFELGNTP